MTGVQQGYNRGTTGVQQGYDRGMTGVQQGYNRGTTGVQQGYSRGTTGVQQGYDRGMTVRKRVRYSELDFEKVMHTRKRHSELYQELNHSSKFHTIDRYSRDPAAMSTFKDKSTADDQHSWDSFKSMTPDPMGLPGDQPDRLELRTKTWDTSPAHHPDTSEGDFQTEV
ncbi:hypothetical protein ACEWY4_027424 [Coilia grayii]|uniref:Uncharacterized protein n=1 Tax=Coilia grayii TaxID=363190 RepID=A0ABD1ISN3_9TELE